LIEVPVGQAGLELVVDPEERRALTGLVVLHEHLVRSPVLMEVVSVAAIGQCLEQRVLPVVEFDPFRPILLLVVPDDMPRVAGPLVLGRALDHEHRAPLGRVIAEVAVDVLVDFL
jgi:hypothetical protein